MHCNKLPVCVARLHIVNKPVNLSVAEALIVIKIICVENRNMNVVVIKREIDARFRILLGNI